MDSGVMVLRDSLDTGGRKGSSTSTFTLIEILKHLLFQAHYSNLGFRNLKLMILATYRKETSGWGISEISEAPVSRAW